MNNPPEPVSNKTQNSFWNAFGPIPYNMTNDYMFHMLLQQNINALKGFLCSLLRLRPEEMQSAEILNPIEYGDTIDAKTFILDIRVLLNNNVILNLEMQISPENWPDRSLSYLCRSFDQLNHGENYSDTKPAIHIGLLNFPPFPDSPEFHACYKLMNVKNHRPYSDKFMLYVVDLTHIKLATEEDKDSHLDDWARFLTAQTWEEVHMLSKNNSYIADAAETLFRLNADNYESERCRAAEEYRRTMGSYQKKLERLTDEKEQLEKKTSQLLNDKEQLEQQLTERNSTILEKEQLLSQQDNTIQELNQTIAELKEQLAKGLPH